MLVDPLLGQAKLKKDCSNLSHEIKPHVSIMTPTGNKFFILLETTLTTTLAVIHSNSQSTALTSTHVSRHKSNTLINYSVTIKSQFT
jgi:hypothetical protein